MDKTKYEKESCFHRSKDNPRKEIFLLVKWKRSKILCLLVTYIEGGLPFKTFEEFTILITCARDKYPKQAVDCFPGIAEEAIKGSYNPNGIAIER